MIGQIGRLVEAGIDHSRRAFALHLLGEITGSVVLAAALAAAGMVLYVLDRNLASAALALGIPALLVLAAASDAGLIGHTLTSDRQTPGAWSCVFGSGLVPLAWGFHLGLVLTTRIPYQSVWVLVAFGMLSGSFWLSLLVLGLYCTSRGAAVWMVAARDTSNVAESCTLVNSWADRLRSAVAAASVALASVLVVAG